MKRRTAQATGLLELALRFCEHGDLRHVLANAYQEMKRSLAVDYAALGVSSFGSAGSLAPPFGRALA